MPAKAKLTTRAESTTQVSSDNFAKGSELTYAEADSNFINLRDQSIAISDGSTSTDIEAGETITFSGATVSGNTVSITGGGSYGDADVDTHLNQGSASSGQILSWNGSDYAWVEDTSASASGGNLANLQVNDTVISPVSTNDDLTLTANGTGEVIIEKLNFTEGTATISSQASNAASIEYKPTSGQDRDRFTIFAGTVSNDASSTKGSEIVLQIKSGENSTKNGIFLRDLNPFVGGGDPDDFVFFGTFGEGVETPHLWIGAGGKLATRSAIKIQSAAIIGGAQQTGDITIQQGRVGAIYTNDFGKIVLSALPTSDPTNAGQLWNDSGTLKISAG